MTNVMAVRVADIRYGASTDAISIRHLQACPSAGGIVELGPFQLLPAERLLLRDGRPIPIGGRSLDILIALADCLEQVVSKADLMARVWPRVAVEEGSLRFHMSMLRKVLSNGYDGDNMIRTVAGWGYRLVAPITLPARMSRIGMASDIPLGIKAGVDGVAAVRIEPMHKGDVACDREYDIPRSPAMVRNEGHTHFLFGPFEFHGKTRALERGGAPVSLGRRALDLLSILVQHPYEVITKRELLETVWPDVMVNDGSLRFQLGVLRRALGDGQGGNRYIVNVPGRGYCFVGRVTAVNCTLASSSCPSLAYLDDGSDINGHDGEPVQGAASTRPWNSHLCPLSREAETL